jgi:ribosome-associated protein
VAARTSRTDVEELVLIGARAAGEKKAADVVALRVGGLLVITDYFLIATGATDRQVHAIADEIEDKLREAGVKPRGREGEAERKWVLLDYGDFVVHVFQPQEREFYRLEKLWGDAPRLKLPAGVENPSGPGPRAQGDPAGAGPGS